MVRSRGARNIRHPGGYLTTRLPSAAGGFGGLPLVGRHTELAELNRLVDRAADGGAVALVEGEAGIGKTRLVEEALESARSADATVLSSRAEEVDAHRPFGAVVDCVAAAAEPAMRDRLRDALGPAEPAPDVAAERRAPRAAGFPRRTR